MKYTNHTAASDREDNHKWDPKLPSSSCAPQRQPTSPQRAAKRTYNQAAFQNKPIRITRNELQAVFIQPYFFVLFCFIINKNNKCLPFPAPLHTAVPVSFTVFGFFDVASAPSPAKKKK